MLHVSPVISFQCPADFDASFHPRLIHLAARDKNVNEDADVPEVPCTSSCHFGTIMLLANLLPIGTQTE